MSFKTLEGFRAMWDASSDHNQTYLVTYFIDVLTLSGIYVY